MCVQDFVGGPETGDSACGVIHVYATWNCATDAPLVPCIRSTVRSVQRRILGGGWWWWWYSISLLLGRLPSPYEVGFSQVSAARLSIILCSV
jgi:hypothetical protein